MKGEKKSEETIEFEGATYRKVEREAREGDVVVFNATTPKFNGQDSYITPGKSYVVSDGNDYENAMFYADDNDYIRVYGKVVGRTRETVDVYEAIEYVPQEGDIVVVTANRSSHANNIGDIGKVGEEEPLADGGVKVYVPGGPTRAIRTKPQDIRKATPAEVEKYEQAVKEASKPKLKAGDYVKFKRGNLDTKAGKPYLIEFYEDDKELAFKDDAGDWCSIARTGEYEILSAEEAKWAKINRKPNEYRIGDIAEVVQYNSGHKVGTIVEIVHLADSDGDLRAKALGTTYCYKPERLKLIAPVESLFNTNA